MTTLNLSQFRTINFSSKFARGSIQNANNIYSRHCNNRFSYRSSNSSLIYYVQPKHPKQYQRVLDNELKHAVTPHKSKVTQCVKYTEKPTSTKINTAIVQCITYTRNGTGTKLSDTDKSANYVSILYVLADAMHFLGVELYVSCNSLILLLLLLLFTFQTKEVQVHDNDSGYTVRFKTAVQMISLKEFKVWMFCRFCCFFKSNIMKFKCF